MGQNLSQEIKKKENEEKNATELFWLRKKEGEMRRKYEEKKAKLYIEALNDECLPIVCAVDKFEEFFLIHHEAGQQSDVRYDIEIRNRMEKHLQGDLKGFVELVQGVVERVVKQDDQSTKQSVVEEQHMHIVSANNSVLRIDYYLYLYEKTLFYFVQVGVLDMTRVRPAVLNYELTRTTQSEKVEEPSKNLMQKMAESSNNVSAALRDFVKAVKDNEAPQPARGGSPPRQQGGPDPTV